MFKEKAGVLELVGGFVCRFWCACSHHNDELQMFTEFVSAKLENTTVTPAIPFLHSLPHSVPAYVFSVPFAWMAVNFKVSLLCERVCECECACTLN